MVIERCLDALLPLAALIDERVAQPDAGAQLEQMLRGIHDSGSRPNINSSDTRR